MLEAKHRYVKMVNDPTNDCIYEFQDFMIQDGLIILRRILDANGILLQNLNSTKSVNFKKMFYDRFCDEWMFLD